MPNLPNVKRFVTPGGVRIYRIPCRVFEYLTARVYLLVGAGPPTLVDTGSGQGQCTDQILAGLGRQGVRDLIAVCPGFTADCLETLDEIGHEGKRIFLEGGGEHLHLVPCLNDHPAWLAAMALIVREETAGWAGESATTVGSGTEKGDSPCAS